MYGKPGKEKEQPRVKPHVRKGDTVIVTSGKDRGKQGKVLRVEPTKGRAIVERVNLQKKHSKPNPQKNVKGGILERESGIRLSNLQVICPSCGERTRTGSHRTAEGAKRFCKKCDTEM
jgi:large subunit ribosomal protein L24